MLPAEASLRVGLADGWRVRGFKACGPATIMLLSARSARRAHHSAAGFPDEHFNACERPSGTGQPNACERPSAAGQFNARE
jgi:hypothetical protein